MKFFTQEIKRKMFLIFFAILIWWSFTNLELLGSGLGFLFQALSPLIIGLIIAFILNRPMMFFERKLLGKRRIKDKYKRILSLLMTLLSFALVIGLVLLIIIPSLISTGGEIKKKGPQYLSQIEDFIKESPLNLSKLEDWIEELDLDNTKDRLLSFVKGGFFDWLNSTFSIASSVLGSIVSFSLGFIFSIYFLLDKEKLVEKLKKLLYLILPFKLYGKIIHIGSLTRKAFSEFVLAQSLEALILGSMFFIAMLIFRFPYSSMVSVVIAVFSFIPIVGSFVGLFVGVVLIFLENPKLAGLFIIMFLVIQQIESNLIYPRVVGKISGLSPLLTLAAVSLGGSLMGILGIILFVPIFAVIQELLEDYMDKEPEGLN